MKHQYVGDINDYRKYALLRALSAGGANRIGVCWMLTPPDGKTDGGKRDYLRKPEQYRHHDPELFDVLQPILDDSSLRRVSYIEESSIIHGATFYADLLPPTSAERTAYMVECRAKFADTDLVFFDPDNGIASPGTKPGQTTTLHVSLHEAAAFYAEGRSVLLYQHRPKLQTWEALIASKSGQVRTVFPDTVMWVFWKADVALFLLIHPDSPARLAIAALDACSLLVHPDSPARPAIEAVETCRSLDSAFIDGQYLGRASSLAG